MATTPFNIFRYYGGTVGPEGNGWVPLFDFGDYLPLTGGTLSGNLTAPRFISTQATGIAPFAVTSTTMVANLTAQYLGAVNQDAAYFLNAANLTGTVNTGRLAGAYTGITSIGTQTTAVTAPNFVSTVATGTPPLTVTSTTMVPGLNADRVDGIEGTALVQTTGDWTMAGGLTINGRLATVGFSNLILGPQLESGHGGQMTFKGFTGFTDWHIDVNSADLRFIAGGTLRASLRDTGRLIFAASTAPPNVTIEIPTPTSTNKRAAIGLGNWEVGQSFNQDAATDFYMWHNTLGEVFRIDPSNADIKLQKRLSFPNGGAIMGVDTGGTMRLAMHPRYSDNAMYLDGGIGGMHLRVNDGTTTVMSLGTDGYARTRGQKVIHGGAGNSTASFDAGGYAYIAHGLGFAPLTVVASPASTFSNGAGVYSLHVASWDATNIQLRAIRADNGSYAVSPLTLAVRWIGCWS